MTSPVLVPTGCPLVSSPAISMTADPTCWRPRRRHCRQSFTPQGTLIAVAGEAHRRGLGAVRADHVDHAGDFRREVFSKCATAI